MAKAAKPMVLKFAVFTESRSVQLCSETTSCPKVPASEKQSLRSDRGAILSTMNGLAEGKQTIYNFHKDLSPDDFGLRLFCERQRSVTDHLCRRRISSAENFQQKFPCSSLKARLQNCLIDTLCIPKTCMRLKRLKLLFGCCVADSVNANIRV